MPMNLDGELMPRVSLTLPIRPNNTDIGSQRLQNVQQIILRGIHNNFINVFDRIDHGSPFLKCLHWLVLLGTVNRWVRLKRYHQDITLSLSILQHDQMTRVQEIKTTGRDSDPLPLISNVGLNPLDLGE